jgi:L-alanine-DL-glutamate epimerase-like enolase superfamily enzyme
MLKLFDGTATLENSELVMSDRPGLGLTFREDTIRQYGVAS